MGQEPYSIRSLILVKPGALREDDRECKMACIQWRGARGIWKKIKTVKVSMMRIGGCVPGWKDEKAEGQSLRREVGGEVRSWCSWCDLR